MGRRKAANEWEDEGRSLFGVRRSRKRTVRRAGQAEPGSAVGRRQIAAENKTYTLRGPSPRYNPLFGGNSEVLIQNNT